MARYSRTINTVDQKYFAHQTGKKFQTKYTGMKVVDHYRSLLSGSGRAIGRVCVSACVRAITFGLNDL